MSKRSPVLTDELRSRVRNDPFWASYLDQAESQTPRFSIHLAVFVEPYLRLVLEGRKTVESRFSEHRIAPYKRAKEGDVILLKQSGGLVVGLCRILRVWFYDLDPQSWEALRREFTQALCAQDPDFWAQRRGASFATLMQIDNVRAIEPLRCVKRDRRGWVLLQPAGQLVMNLET